MSTVPTISKQVPYNPSMNQQPGPPPPYSASSVPPLGFQTVHTVQYQNQPRTIYTQPRGSANDVTTHRVIQPVVIMTGASCPACRRGVLGPQFTCLGIFFAIFFFPFGIMCCFLLMERRCSNCQLAFA